MSIEDKIRIAGQVKMTVTDKALAKSAGISPASLSLYFQAKRSPNMETIAAMAKGWGISQEDVIAYIIHRRNQYEAQKAKETPTQNG